MMDQTFDQFGGGLPLGDGDAWPEVERAPVSIAVPWTEPGPPAPETIADDMRSRAGRTVDLLGAEIGPEDSGSAVVSSLFGGGTDGACFCVAGRDRCTDGPACR